MLFPEVVYKGGLSILLRSNTLDVILLKRTRDINGVRVKVCLKHKDFCYFHLNILFIVSVDETNSKLLSANYLI